MNSQKPERHGVKWYQDEDILIMEYSKKGLSIEDIAKIQKRTDYAIKVRLIKNYLEILGYSEESLLQISSILKISINDIEKLKKLKKNDKLKKEKDSIFLLLTEIRDLLLVLLDK